MNDRACVFIVHRSSFIVMSIRGILRYAIQSLTGGSNMLKLGDPAPDFDTKDHTGKPISLKNLRGKKVVLWFFPKADTPG